MRKVNSTNSINQVSIMETCPLADALSTIDSRWKPLVLQKLFDKPLRFTQLRELIPLVTERMLVLSLKELEQDGLISRIEYPGFPRHVEYSLTESGISLAEILHQLSRWASNRRGKTRTCLP